MKKMIVSGNLGSATTVRMVHLRDGLQPLLSEEIGNFPSHSAQGTPSQRMSISPDRTKIVSTNGGSNTPATMNYYGAITEDVTFTEAFTHAVSFSGTVNCCAVSNSLRAYGGTNPFLYVFDLVTGGLQAVPVTGLGAVYAIAFSPDGSRLAVCHSTTPFLRVYNVADWSYVNAATAFVAYATDVCWTANGEKIVVVSSSSSDGVLAVYSKEGVRLFSSTTLQAYVMNAAHVLSGENAAIVSGSGVGATTNSRIRKIDLDTFSVTTLVEATAATNSLCVDEADGKGYVVHSAIGGRYISEFPLAGGALEPTSPTLQALVINNNACLKLLEKDTGRVTGTVRDIGNLPAQRTILAYERISGRLSGKTISDAVTGNYTLNLPNTREHDLVFQAHPSEQLNDLFFARVQPQAV